MTHPQTAGFSRAGGGGLTHRRWWSPAQVRTARLLSLRRVWVLLVLVPVLVLVLVLVPVLVLALPPVVCPIALVPVSVVPLLQAPVPVPGRGSSR